MGFLAKLGSSARKLFGGNSPKAVAPKVGSSGTLRDTPSTDLGFGRINDLLDLGQGGIRETVRDVFAPQEREPTDPLAKFLAGELTNVVSSNVDSIQYIAEDKTLIIAYHGGGKGLQWYGYSPVDVALATSLFNAGSKGGWVWDRLRVRGTVFGYQVEYFFMDGPSAKEPKWHKKQEWRIEHGGIGPEGEIPESWREGKGPYPPSYG